ncbi:MAG: NAD(P)H-hydrate dehydratase [Bdellovibrio sp.]|jgi:hydroxyethylthiazole kinase-like uncharacterized protein yjeF
MKQRRELSYDATKTRVTSNLDLKRWFPPRGNEPDFNKATFGHTVIFAGSIHYAGAAILSANAAMRSGTGYVTLVVPAQVRFSVESRLYPSVIIKTLPDGGSGYFRSSSLEAAIKLTLKATAVAFGPGIGMEPQTCVFFKKFLMRYAGPLVLDADALNFLAQEPDQGRALLLPRKAPTILTPHPGEMGRLMGLESEQVQKNRLKLVRKLARACGCIVVLKGFQTLIADADGSCYQNPTGHAGLATAGMGDVLTGLLSGLLAQGFDPYHSAVGGVFIHGRAGDLIATKNGGVIGLTAHDLIESLPAARHCHIK